MPKGQNALDQSQVMLSESPGYRTSSSSIPFPSCVSCGIFESFLPLHPLTTTHHLQILGFSLFYSVTASMTTFQGLPGNKNSSRVLRPPGGGDSNIFGTDEPAANPAKRVIAAPPSNNIFGPPTTQEPPRRKKEDTGSNIFGNDTSDHQTPEQAQNKDKEEEKEKAVENNNDQQSNAQSAMAYANRMHQGINPITGEEMGVPSSPNVKSPNNRVNRGSFNPITGEGNQESSGVKSSSRVRQPPGGFSSKLW